MGYVDKKYVESKGYTKERFDTIKDHIKDIKTNIRTINSNILKLAKGK